MQVQFKGCTYEAQELPLRPVLVEIGMRKQFAIIGKRGAQGLMQVFDCSKRVVWLAKNSTRVNVEYGVAA